MKFKKFLASVAAISMLASVAAVSVNADEAAGDDVAAQETPVIGGDDSAKPYSIDFEPVEGTDGCVVSYVHDVAAGISEIVIPDKDNDGHDVIGVANYAFADADVATIVVPETLKADYIGDLAFLTKMDIDLYVQEAGDLTADEIIDFLTNEGAQAKALTYAANVVEFKGKNDWKADDEELAAAGVVLHNLYHKLQVAEDDQYDSAGEFVVRFYNAVVLDGEKDELVRPNDENNDNTRMSEKSFEKFVAWNKAVKYYNLTLVGKKDTDIAKYAQGKEILGINWEEDGHSLRGDANHDGEVNVRDAAYIANRLANEKVEDLDDCADYNQDGEKNVRDAAAIAKDLANGKI